MKLNNRLKKSSGIAIVTCIILFVYCSGEKKGAQTSDKESANTALSQATGHDYKPKIGTYGGELRLPMGADPDVLCPLLSVTVYGQSIGGLLFEPLITRDLKTLNFKPNLAKKWEVSEDGLTWTFHLRDDVYFSDKTKLSAYDVAFTMDDIIYNTKNNCQSMYLMQVDNKNFVTSVIDSFTVQFKLPVKFAPFLEVMQIAILPKHKYHQIAVEGKLQDFLHAGKPLDNFVTTGPFVLDKVELGQRVVLKRNPLFYKKDSAGNSLPYLDRLTYLVIQDANSAMLRFQNGEIDQYAIAGGEQYATLKPLEKEKKFKIYRMGPSFMDQFVFFNENNQKDEKTGNYFLEEKKQHWFQNKNFRKACAYAINDKDIVNNVFSGLAVPSTGIFGKHRGYFHNDKAPKYSYDPEKAKQLLHDEGFKDTNGDGFLEDKDGNQVEFTIVAMAGDKIVKNIYEMVTKDLQNIGLKAQVQFQEFNVIIDKITSTYQWDAIGIAFGGPLADPHFNKSFFMSKSYQYPTNPPRRDKNGNVLPKVEQPWEERCNEIFELAAKEMDKEKRKALYDEWQQLFMDQSQWVLLPVSEIILATSDRFENVYQSPGASMAETMFPNIEEIYVKPEALAH